MMRKVSRHPFSSTNNWLMFFVMRPPNSLLIPKKSKGSRKRKRQPNLPDIDHFAQADLDDAVKLIEKEAEDAGPPSVDPVLLAEAWDASFQDSKYIPARRGYASLANENAQQQLAAIQQEFRLAKAHLTTRAGKADKLERKIDIMTQGYQRRVQSLRRELLEEEVSLVELMEENESFYLVGDRELTMIPNRVNDWKAQVRVQSDIEAQMQNKYVKLVGERNRLRGLLASAARVAKAS